MKMKYIKMMLITGLLVLFAGSAAWAHMLWFNASNFHPDKGQTVFLEIGFGHHFPRDEAVKAGRLQPVEIVAPDGKKQPARQIFPGFYAFTPEQEGAYWIQTALKPGFVSKTTDGRKLGSKKTLDNVVSCFAYRITANTVVNCGQAGNPLNRKKEDSLEIVPLKNPEDLAAGDTLFVKVLFKGEPLTRATVSFRHKGVQADKTPQVITSGKGLAEIRLDQKGSWMIWARHKAPYPDEAECDAYSYFSSLTFDI